jgi:hypothetical protein
MKTRSLVTLLAICLTCLASAFAISNPQSLQYPVNSYQNWRGYVINGNSATGAQTILVQLQGIELPSLQNPYNPLGGANGEAFVPILVDQDAVTPTAVSCGIPAPTGVNVPGNGFLCNVTATFAAVHGTGSVLSSNDSGLQEALNDAFLHGGGVVTIDGTSGVSTAQIAAASPYPSVYIENRSAGGPSYWTTQPSNVSVLNTPVVRTASASCPATLLATTVCNNASTGGTWPNSAEYVCVTYVDMMGLESPCSTTAHFTSGGTTSTIEFVAPAASTGAVGWRAYAGLAYLTTAYQLPITSANCTLTALVPNGLPACAIANATYNQAGSNGIFTTPTVHTQMVPQAGGVAAAYNPNPISFQAYAYQPSPKPPIGFLQNYPAFPVTAALTAGQLGVLGTVPLPAGALNYIGQSLQITGSIVYTPTTGGTAPTFNVEIGDLTDFSTGTPKAVCTFAEVHTVTTTTYNVSFVCTMNTNAIGTSGTIMPGGWLLDAANGGTTLGVPTAEQSALAGITIDTQDQDTIFIVFLQTSAAETTGPTLTDLHITFI